MNLFKQIFIFIGLAIVIGSLDASEAGKQSWWQSAKNWWHGGNASFQREKQFEQTCEKLNKPIRPEDIVKVKMLKQYRGKFGRTGMFQEKVVGYAKDGRKITVDSRTSTLDPEDKKIRKITCLNRVCIGDYDWREPKKNQGTFDMLNKIYQQQQDRGLTPYLQQVAEQRFGHYSSFE